MAIAGNAITTAYNGRYYKFEWSAEQDIANNKSKITWKLSAEGGSSEWYAERTLKLVVNGASLYDKSNRVERYAGEITSGSFSLTHNSSGDCSFTVDMKAAVYVNEVNLTRTKTFTLNTIPRAATLTSAPNFTDAQAPVIKYSNPAGSNVTSLQACISLDGSAADIPYRNVSKTSGTYTFQLTSAEKKTLRDGTSGNSRTVKFILKTVIGGETYTSTLTKTFSISDTSISFSPTAYDSNTFTTSLTGNNKYIIKGYSNYYFSAGASAASGSIEEVKATCGGASIVGNTGTFNGATSAIINFTAKDSRGNTGTGSVSNVLLDYFKPTLSVEVTPTSTSGELTIYVSGTYYNASFGKVANSLVCNYSISHEGSGYSNGARMDLEIDGDNFSSSVTITGLDYRKVYIIKVNCYDELEEVSIEPIKSIGKPIYDWNNEDFNFNVPIKIEEATVLKRSSNNVVLSANGGSLYLRPNGDSNTTGEVKIGSGGTVEAKGAIKAPSAEFTGTVSAASVKLGSNYIGTQSILHTDEGRHFVSTHNVKLTGAKRITNQVNGYIFVWYLRLDGNMYAANINYTYVPKCITSLPTKQVTMVIGAEDAVNIGCKTVSVTDDGTTTTITGHDANNDTKNDKWVLRYIIGY